MIRTTPKVITLRGGVKLNMKFMFFRKEEIIMAEPFVPLTIVETGLLSGTTGVVFVLTGPTLAALLGAHLACTTLGCSVATSAVGGLTGGLAAGTTGASISAYLTRKRYKKWLKDNAQKYVVNKFGRLERLPMCFIVCMSPVRIPSWVIIVAPTVYSFVVSYVKVKNSEKNNLCSHRR